MGTIVYLAAITGIDQGLYEAAAIDGSRTLAADVAYHFIQYPVDDRSAVDFPAW